MENLKTFPPYSILVLLVKLLWIDHMRFNTFFFFISLIKAIFLQGFDGNPTGSGPVTHFVYIPFVPLSCTPELTRLFITDIPQFLIMISLP